MITMSKNPVLQKKYQEGYKQGFEHGKYTAVSYFADKIEQLQDAKGIGNKTFDKIMEAIGREFFRKTNNKR